MGASQALSPIIRSIKRDKPRATTSNHYLAVGPGPGAAAAASDETLRDTGGVISAVDIIHGLGVYAGLERIDVPGITGFLDTNYRGKASMASFAGEERLGVYSC